MLGEQESGNGCGEIAQLGKKALMSRDQSPPGRRRGRRVRPHRGRGGG